MLDQSNDIFPTIASYCDPTALASLRTVSTKSKLIIETYLERAANEDFTDDSWLECNFSGIDGSAGSISFKKGWTKRFAERDDLITFAAEAKAYGKRFEDRGAQLLLSRMNNSPNMNKGWLDYEDFLESSNLENEIQSSCGLYVTRRSGRLNGKIGSNIYDPTSVNKNKESLGNNDKIESKLDDLPQVNDESDEESYDSFEYDDDEDSLDSRKLVDLDDACHFEERCRLIGDRSKLIMDKDHGYAIDITHDALVTRERALKMVLEMTKMDSGSLSDELANNALTQMKLLLIVFVYRASSIRFACYDAEYRHDREKVCHSALMFVDSKGDTKYELLRQEKKQYDNDIE
jgi:hypothetical protein